MSHFGSVERHYRLEIQRLDSAIDAVTLKYEEAVDYGLKQYEKYV
jgi:hypothetical protein